MPVCMAYEMNKFIIPKVPDFVLEETRISLKRETGDLNCNGGDKKHAAELNLRLRMAIYQIYKYE